MNYKYLIKFDIETDGDWNFESLNQKLILCKSGIFVEKIIIKKIKKILNTINGRDFIVEYVKSCLTKYLNELNHYNIGEVLDMDDTQYNDYLNNIMNQNDYIFDESLRELGLSRNDYHKMLGSDIQINGCYLSDIEKLIKKNGYRNDLLSLNNYSYNKMFNFGNSSISITVKHIKLIDNKETLNIVELQHEKI